jgi:hypothetical protein
LERRREVEAHFRELIQKWASLTLAVQKEENWIFFGDRLGINHENAHLHSGLEPDFINSVKRFSIRWGSGC